MSINKIIKQHLPVTKQALPQVNTVLTHCQNGHFGYCYGCKERKMKLCNEKLLFKSVNQVSTIRWHLTFTCVKKHKIIRWVIIDDTSIVVGVVKN